MSRKEVEGERGRRDRGKERRYKNKGGGERKGRGEKKNAHVLRKAA